MKVQAYLLLVELSEQLRGASYERHLVAENYAVNSLTRKKTGQVGVALRDLEFAQIRLDRLNKLSNPAVLFVMRNIIEKLFKYNLFWYHPSAKKSSEKNILKELVDVQLLFRTETLGMYIVNPAWIWRGTMFTCVEATKTLLRKEGKPSMEMLRDLKPSADYILNEDKDHFHLLGSNTFHTSMLKEPDAPDYPTTR